MPLLLDNSSPQSASSMLCVTGTADLNVPMFIALRRFTLVCTIVLERSLMHKQHDRATLGAVALMIGGAAALSLHYTLHTAQNHFSNHPYSRYNDIVSAHLLSKFLTRPNLASAP